MAEIKTFACDVCHTQKKDSNQWWRVFRIAGGLAIMNWHVEVDDNDQWLLEKMPAHLCGQQCVTEYISKTIFTVLDNARRKADDEA